MASKSDASDTFESDFDSDSPDSASPRLINRLLTLSKQQSQVRPRLQAINFDISAWMMDVSFTCLAVVFYVLLFLFSSSKSTRSFHFFGIRMFEYLAKCTVSETLVCSNILPNVPYGKLWTL